MYVCESMYVCINYVCMWLGMSVCLKRTDRHVCMSANIYTHKHTHKKAHTHTTSFFPATYTHAGKRKHCFTCCECLHHTRHAADILCHIDLSNYAYGAHTTHLPLYLMPKCIFPHHNNDDDKKTKRCFAAPLAVRPSYIYMCNA